MPMEEGDPETEVSHPKVRKRSPGTSDGDPKTSDGDPETLKGDPEMPNGDAKPTNGDAESPTGDPKTSQRTPPPEGPPLFAGEPGGERWGRPKTGMWGRPRRPPARTRLRNRRYAALQQLIREGEYFSEEEMRAREPLLYQQYIGQYRGAEPLPGDPPASPPHFLGSPQSLGTPRSLSELLLRSVEEAAVQRRLRHQRLREGGSSDEERDPPSPPDPAERAMLREEFRTRMYQRFLDGQDGDFDYSQVDENPDLDNLDIVSRDAEERYFDAEEPSTAPLLE